MALTFAIKVFEHSGSGKVSPLTNCFQALYHSLQRLPSNRPSKEAESDAMLGGNEFDCRNFLVDWLR
jgi:hypothetical protein